MALVKEDYYFICTLGFHVEAVQLGDLRSVEFLLVPHSLEGRVGNPTHKLILEGA